MAGLKNQYQLLGGTPFQKVEGKDPIERHMNLLQREYTPYCVLCGREIIPAKQNEVGRPVNYQWEMENRVHTHCYGQNQR